MNYLDNVYLLSKLYIILQTLILRTLNHLKRIEMVATFGSKGSPIINQIEEIVKWFFKEIGHHISHSTYIGFIELIL